VAEAWTVSSLSGFYETTPEHEVGPCTPEGIEQALDIRSRVLAIGVTFDDSVETVGDRESVGGSAGESNAAVSVEVDDIRSSRTRNLTGSI